MRATVVGAGVVGLTTAVTLAERGAKVTLVERSREIGLELVARRGEGPQIANDLVALHAGRLFAPAPHQQQEPQQR